MTLNTDSIFSALSHPMRLRAVVLIQKMNELCVCELTHALDIAQPVISRHLAQLKEAGLLASRRQGTWVYYRINSEVPVWIHQIISITSDGIAATPPYSDDLASLKQMSNRPTNTCSN